MCVAAALLCMRQEREVYVFGAVLLNDFPDLRVTRAESWLSVYTFDELAKRFLPSERTALLARTHAASGMDATAAAAGLPIQRLGRAEEVAEAVAWLLSEAASYTVGALLDVAGGR
jgi:hypothetical protein